MGRPQRAVLTQKSEPFAPTYFTVTQLLDTIDYVTDDEDGFIYAVTQQAPYRILKFTPSGKFLWQFELDAAIQQLKVAYGRLTFRSIGTGTYNGIVAVDSSDGSLIFKKYITTGLSTAVEDVITDSSNNTYVVYDTTSTTYFRVLKLDPSGNLVWQTRNVTQDYASRVAISNDEQYLYVAGGQDLGASGDWASVFKLYTATGLDAQANEVRIAASTINFYIDKMFVAPSGNLYVHYNSHDGLYPSNTVCFNGDTLATISDNRLGSSSQAYKLGGLDEAGITLALLDKNSALTKLNSTSVGIELSTQSIQKIEPRDLEVSQNTFRMFLFDDLSGGFSCVPFELPTGEHPTMDVNDLAIFAGGNPNAPTLTDSSNFSVDTIASVLTYTSVHSVSEVLSTTEVLSIAVVSPDESFNVFDAGMTT